ncbi:uncharacterized protein LOC123410416 [Hordeum vulgare subsp. vulgare]|uniref:DUF6598 domain-containing protein n=1 Tax=Hordeum vulgare subsp. vulgare TaxID=112509 RepID=A0A8I6W5X7_HORVV|nr:uncharacterized protein LOC123410416 [Hordeum vulgare subsp. vulgare]
MSSDLKAKGTIDAFVLSEELYGAAKLMLESVSQIEVLQEKMISTGRCGSEHMDLLKLKSDMFHVSERILRLADPEMQTQGKIGQDAVAVLPDLVAKETQETIAGQAGNPFLCEPVSKFISGILSKKFDEDVGDVASVLEAERTSKEAAAALSFAFRLGLCCKRIDEVWREMREILRSFSAEKKDLVKTMTMFASEPYVRRIAKLKWISARITRLRRLDPDLDSKVKSTLVRLKSESFLSAMEEEREGVAGQDGAKSYAEMDKSFAAYRLFWERTWGTDYSFENQTLLSPMQFTHCTPGRIPVDAVAGSTLQINSIKVSAAEELGHSLEVYGVVAARDVADRHRNPLFLRTWNDCQVLTKQDPFLQLTGPVRAIVSTDTVYIEIQLKVKDSAKSEDRALVSTFYLYNAEQHGSFLVSSSLCTVELCCERFQESVQATILSAVVKAKEGSSIFPHGGRVVCSSLPCQGYEDTIGLPSTEVVLLDSQDGRIPMARNGHLDLLRRVVSVELKGKLKFIIKTYSPSHPAEVATYDVLFTPEKCNISKKTCNLDGGSKMEITVAWSYLPASKMLS